jgi:GNAT superfamily N-acetyltransferase
MRLVEWQPRHRGNLDRALGVPDQLCAQARPVFGRSVGGSEWRFTMVAESDGEVVGAAVAFSPRWHAFRVWVSVEVAASHRRLGIGKALLEAVRERCRADGRPLRGKVFAGSPASGFAASQGFSVIQRSRTFRVETGPVATTEDLVVEGGAAPALAAAAFRDFYLSSHDWDPPGPMTEADISRTHLAEATGTILVRSPAGESLAVGFLFDQDGAVVLSGGPTKPTDPRAEIAVASLLDCIPKPLLVEADDSVAALLAALTARQATVIDEIHIVAEG